MDASRLLIDLRYIPEIPSDLAADKKFKKYITYYKIIKNFKLTLIQIRLRRIIRPWLYNPKCVNPLTGVVGGPMFRRLYKEQFPSDIDVIQY